MEGRPESPEAGGQGAWAVTPADAVGGFSGKGAMVPERPLRVALVDDAADLRALVRMRLESVGGFQVVGEGGNGREAIELTRSHRPDVVLLDVSMPVMDGLDALPKIRQACADTRVVMFTGFEHTGLEARALALGAAAFIEKSTSLLELPARLRDAMTELPPPPALEVAPQPTSSANVNLDDDGGLLAEHLERFREAFEGATIGMAAMTLSGHVVRSNAALAQMVGSREEDLLGVAFTDIVHESYRAQAQSFVATAGGITTAISFEHRVPAGLSAIWVRSTVSSVCDSQGRPLYLFLQMLDTTSENEAVRALFTSEQLFQTLVEGVSDYAIFMLDVDGNILSWNAGAQKMKGYSAADILGKNFRIFYTADAKQRRHPEEELELARREGRYEEEGWRVRKDGSQFWAHVIITALRDATGNLIGFAKVTHDATQRRRAADERDRSADRLRTANDQLQKAADDRSEFLAVTAHELRGPAGVMRRAAETIATDWDTLTAEARDHVLRILMNAGDRLGRLVDDLLLGARAQAGGLALAIEPVAVKAALSEAASGIVAGDGSPVAVDCADGLAAMADRGSLVQIIFNLLTNAVVHGAPPIAVSARQRGDFIEFRVRDSGGGIADTDIPKLFTKFGAMGGHGGAGIGLFVVDELTRAQGGHARYEHDGAGESCFIIELPAAVGSSAPAA